MRRRFLLVACSLLLAGCGQPSEDVGATSNDLLACPDLYPDGSAGACTDLVVAPSAATAPFGWYCMSRGPVVSTDDSLQGNLDLWTDGRGHYALNERLRLTTPGLLAGSFVVGDGDPVHFDAAGADGWYPWTAATRSEWQYDLHFFRLDESPWPDAVLQPIASTYDGEPWFVLAIEHDGQTSYVDPMVLTSFGWTAGDVSQDIEGGRLVVVHSLSNAGINFEDIELPDPTCQA